MNFSEYSQIPAVNFSTLKEMARSPKAYQHRLTHPREDTAAMALGRAVHTAVLEADRLPLEYAVWEGRRGTNDFKDFVLAQGARQILTVADYAHILAIRDAVHAHPVAGKLLVKGKPEETADWRDRATGLACKCRIDFLSSRYLIDLKTTRSIEPWSFAGDAARLKYVHQLAYYRRGLIGDRAVRIIAVESEPPHDVAVYKVPESLLCAADVEIDDLLARVVECTASGIWPGAYPEPVELDVPGWAFDDYESGAIALES